MVRAFTGVASVLFLAVFALLGARAVSAHDPAEDAWRQEWLSALRHRLEVLEREGHETAAATVRREIEVVEKSMKGPSQPDRVLRDKQAEKQPATPEQLERQAVELRAHANALRERGSIEDAEHVARKAEIALRMARLRRASNEKEHESHALKANGKGSEAERAMEEAKRLWQQSLETERGDALREKARPPMQRAEHLKIAAKHLMEAGMPDLAERVAKEAAEASEPRKAPEGAGEGQPRKDGERAGIRAEMDRLREEIRAVRAMLDEMRGALKADR